MVEVVDLCSNVQDEIGWRELMELWEKGVE